MAERDGQGREALASINWDVIAQAFHSERGWYPVKDAIADEVDRLLKAHDAKVAAGALREAADAIQAMHPGEVKNSVLFLRARADESNHR